MLTAANGAEAVTLFARNRPHVAVVVTDMAMPLMDGPTTVAALRALEPNTKIVGGATTAAGVDLDRFVGKPYVADVLLRTLREVIEEKPRQGG